MSYSSENDIKVGDIPLPSYIDKAALVSDAADEIDSYIGFIYETPVDTSSTSTLSRPASLLLKRINVSLATGRLVLEVAASGENESLHSYGVRLLREAHEALQQIASGAIVLEGAIKMPDETGKVHGPLLYNEDDRSQVEAFYGYFGAGGTKIPMTP